MGAADQLSARGPAPAHSGWLVANLVTQLAFGLLAMTACLPSMQEWPAQFDASQAAVQLTFSAFVATYGGMQLVYGALSDRVGRKPALVAGLLLAFAGSVAAALSRDLTMLVLSRALQGAGCAAGMVIARAMVQDLFTGPERTRVMALIGMSMGVCPPLAAVVGGQLHVRLGWQANFALVAVLSLLLLAAAWFGLPGPAPADGAPKARGPSPLAGYLRLAREPSFWLYVGLLATLTATFYSFLAGLPLVLAGYGVTPERLGWAIGCVPVAYIAGNYLTTRLARTQPERRIMNWGQALTIGALVLALALGLAGLRSPLAVVLPLLLLGIGHGLLVPPTLAGTVGVVPALAGSAAAVGGLAQQLVGAFGAFLVGLVPHQGHVNLVGLMLGWTLLGFACQLALRRLARLR
ncbi:MULTISPECIES: MFS transporter [Ramlibacter]|uniref:MFS transporter n=1 Tax=Ramlibacter pinisoli TaxID=2682844 RepID=A0A6N8IMN3_9BURK|nr:MULTISPECIES: MFS transporter [Ramlibacter]MBA2963140.1 MFS transporter [Ramlibacter sp. CGMCC 1.13660]MVQ28109.1 MFS transporter [Ramlibacter pinisoli]